MVLQGTCFSEIKSDWLLTFWACRLVAAFGFNRIKTCGFWCYTKSKSSLDLSTTSLMLHSVRHIEYVAVLWKNTNECKVDRARDALWSFQHEIDDLIVTQDADDGKRTDFEIFSINGRQRSILLPFSFRPRQNCLPDRLAIMTSRNPTADAQDEIRKSDSNNTHPPRLLLPFLDKRSWYNNNQKTAIDFSCQLQRLCFRQYNIAQTKKGADTIKGRMQRSIFHFHQVFNFLKKDKRIRWKFYNDYVVVVCIVVPFRHAM